VHPGAHTVTPTLSIGLALADRGEDVGAALRRADAALYERKRARGYPGRTQEPLA
jgi:GGDEF domain-containing protein